METKEYIEMTLRSQEREIESAAEDLKTQCNWLLSNLNDTIKRIDKKDYVLINSCGVIQSNGTAIDLSVGRLRSLIDSYEKMKSMQKEIIKN